MAPKYVYIHNNKQLAKVAQGLRDYALQAWATLPMFTDPGHSKTEAEAVEKAQVLVEANDEGAFANSRWLLLMPMRMPVTVMLSIDVMFDQGPVWHLSMSTPGPDQTVNRVPKMFAVRVLMAFFDDSQEVVEGPSEGAFKNVKHFRLPYKVDVCA